MTSIDATTLRRTRLHRQWLDRRRSASVPDAVAHLAGLPAPTPETPYLSLAARVEGISVDQVTAAIEDGSVVTTLLWHARLHLTRRSDVTTLRAGVVGELAESQRVAFGSATSSVDLDELVELARVFLSDRAPTGLELGRALATRWPHVTAGSLAGSVQRLLPVIHPAPGGTWRRTGPLPFALDPPATPSRAAPREEVVRRHLAARGPATTEEIEAECGAAGLGDVVERMPELVRRPGPGGLDLLDLPGAPLVDDGPTPPRLLPVGDPALGAGPPPPAAPGAGPSGVVVVDGRVVAGWRLEDRPKFSLVRLWRTGPDTVGWGGIRHEAHALLDFARPGVRHVVQHDRG